MEEMMCRHCGSLLESRDLVCPCCKTPRSVSKKTEYKPPRPEQKNREGLFDMGPDKSGKISLDKLNLSGIFGNRQQNSTYRHNREYMKPENTSGLSCVGFLFGCFIPIIFTIIIAITCSEKMLCANKHMTVRQKSIARAFRKGMVRGAVCIQIAIPMIILVLGLLIEYL